MESQMNPACALALLSKDGVRPEDVSSHVFTSNVENGYISK